MIVVPRWDCVYVCWPTVEEGVCAGWTSSECSCRYSSMTSRSTSGQEEGATPLQATRSPLSRISVTKAIWRRQRGRAVFRDHTGLLFFSPSHWWWCWCDVDTLHDGCVSRSLRWCQATTAHLLFLFSRTLHCSLCWVNWPWVALIHQF